MTPGVFVPCVHPNHMHTTGTGCLRPSCPPYPLPSGGNLQSQLLYGLRAGPLRDPLRTSPTSGVFTENLRELPARWTTQSGISGHCRCTVPGRDPSLPRASLPCNVLTECVIYGCLHLRWCPYFSNTLVGQIFFLPLEGHLGINRAPRHVG